MATDADRTQDARVAAANAARQRILALPEWTLVRIGWEITPGSVQGRVFYRFLDGLGPGDRDSSPRMVLDREVSASSMYQQWGIEVLALPGAADRIAEPQPDARAHAAVREALAEIGASDEVRAALERVIEARAVPAPTPDAYERVGTWLLPEHYGNEYDHFTQTKAQNIAGASVPLYALRSDLDEQKRARASVPAPTGDEIAKLCETLHQHAMLGGPKAREVGYGISDADLLLAAEDALRNRAVPAPTPDAPRAQGEGPSRDVLMHENNALRATAGQLAEAVRKLMGVGLIPEEWTALHEALAAFDASTKGET